MILLDTNIVIYLFNGVKDIASQMNLYSPEDIGISFITLGELVFGAQHSKQKEHNLLKVFEFSEKIQILHSSKELAKQYGNLKQKSISQGKFPGDHDLWIAATALEENAVLITNNEKHFRWIEELKIENWLK